MSTVKVNQIQNVAGTSLLSSSGTSVPGVYSFAPGN